MVAIIDYGVGNLASIKNMLKRIGYESVISGDAGVINAADKLILPGVGAFDYGMGHLNQSGLVDLLNEKVLVQKVPILGICLGVQLFTEKSEEGVLPGLGWIKGKTISFDRSRLGADHKIPHMGWTDVFNYSASKLFTGMFNEPRFYFVHSYHLAVERENEKMVSASYGYEFTAGIEKENILGVQFHPEKSHKFGMKVLDNFIRYY
jgi:imidazole glycerol-phosphate synthase subunit HisH